MDDDFYQDIMSVKLSKQKYASSKILTENDKTLLEDYAPKLFNTIDNEREAGKMMKGLLKVLYKYRYETSEYSIPNDAKKRIPTYKHRSIEDKAIALKKKIAKSNKTISTLKEIIDLMGGENFHTVQGEELKKHFNGLKKHLLNADRHPKEYIPIIRTTKITKKEIEDYLIGLNLSKKGATIKDFLAKIQ